MKPRFHWEGPTDEVGLPIHLPMGVNERGQGPESDREADHYVCWCNDEECRLTVALHLAWSAGFRQGMKP